MSCNVISELTLFYILCVLWVMGVLFSILEHPYRCLFFPVPAAGTSPLTPDNPHENPTATPFYTLTHQFTLTTYIVFSILMQGIGFGVWYIQMKYHDFIEDRIRLEQLAAGRFQGLVNCCLSMFRKPMEEGDVMTPSSSCDCIWGCCWLWSTSCALYVFNTLMLVWSFFMMLWGYGTLESANRAAQNPTCRAGVPCGVYIFVLNIMCVIMYFVMICMRLTCRVVHHAQVAHHPTKRPPSKKGGKATKVTYMKVGNNSAQQVDVEEFMDGDDDVIIDLDDTDNHDTRSPGSHPPSITKLQNKAKKKNNNQPQHLDADTVEMLDMLDASDLAHPPTDATITFQHIDVANTVPTHHSQANAFNTHSQQTSASTAFEIGTEYEEEEEEADEAAH